METFWKSIISFGVLVCASIPTWAWLLINHFLKPQGFWEKALVIGGGIFLLGGLQIFLVIVAVVLIAKIWTL